MNLIQQIRAKQVLKEEQLDLPIKIRHQNDVSTEIGDKKFALIFPKFMLGYSNEKNIDQLFVGLITKKRKPFLSKFNNATIINSNRGRKKETKERDEEYFALMSRARFVLCPNGDFVWTYRFFESIIFKAIPIIEDFHPLYKGYKFYTSEDELVYNDDWICSNLEKIKKEMFWDNNIKD